MRIAYFADSLPPQTDGVSRTLVNLAHSLQSEDIEFLFISPFKPNGEVPWSERVVKVPSIAFILYPEYRIGLPTAKYSRDILDEFKPDIVHATSPTLLGKSALNYATRTGIPAVASYHTDFVSYFKYYGFGVAEDLGWRILKWFYNQFSRVFVPSYSTMRDLQQKGFINTDIWPRGIDIQRFSPSFRSNHIRDTIVGDGEAMLLFVGRLVREKDLEDLVSVNRILEANNQKFRMVFVGDGPLRPYLEKEMPRAYFTGYLHGSDLAEWYASADIFIFPSTTETFGNVILEAYASGLPVIGVDMGGVMDLLDDGRTGFVSRANNPPEFAQKIQVLLSSKKMRDEFSGNAQILARQYSWKTINGRLIDTYRTLISDHKNAPKKWIPSHDNIYVHPNSAEDHSEENRKWQNG